MFKKKVLSMILAMLMVFSCINVEAFADVDDKTLDKAEEVIEEEKDEAIEEEEKPSEEEPLLEEEKVLEEEEKATEEESTSEVEESKFPEEEPVVEEEKSSEKEEKVLEEEEKSSEEDMTSEVEEGKLPEEDKPLEKEEKSSEEKATEEERASEVEEEKGVSEEEKPSEEKDKASEEDKQKEAPKLRSGEFDATKVDLNLEMPEEAVLTATLFKIKCNIDLTKVKDGELKNPRLKLKFPKKYIGRTDLHQIGDLITSTGYTVEEDENHWNVIYTFDRLASGTALTVPFVIKMKDKTTPDKAKVKIEVELYTEKNDGTTEEVSKASDIVVAKVGTNRFLQNRVKGSEKDDKTIYAGPADSTDATKVTGDVDSTKTIPFNHILFLPAKSRGFRSYEKIVVKNTLPEGSVFLKEDNPDWTLSADGKTAIYVETFSYPYSGYGHRHYSQKRLLLRFPGADINKTYNNRTVMELTPYQMSADEEVIKVADNIRFKLSNKQELSKYSIRKNGFQVFNSSEENFKKEYSWNLGVSRYGYQKPEKMKDVVITDYDLDEDLKYTAIEIPKPQKPSYHSLTKGDKPGEYTVSYIDKDNKEVTLVTGHSGPLAKTPLPDGVKKIIFKTDKGTIMSVKTYFNIKVYTKFKKTVYPQKPKFIEKYNSMKLEAGFVDRPNTTLHLNHKAKAVIVNPNTEVRFTKSAMASHLGEISGKDITYRLNLGLDRDGEKEFYNLKDIKIVDFIPDGFEYVDNSTRIERYKNEKPYEDILLLGEPKKIINYKGSGKTALIWDLGDVDLMHSHKSLRVYYKLKITRYANIGENDNIAYMLYSNPNIVQRGRGTKADIYDLDDDGDKAEEILYGEDTVIYLPSEELVSSKRVKSEMDEQYILTGSRSEVGKSARYNMQIQNLSPVDYKDITVVDVLPYKGDMSLVEDKQGNLLPRNSEFDVTLSGPVSGTDKFDYYYTTVKPAQGETAATYSNKNIWSSSVSDYSKVVGIKGVLKQGQAIKREETVNFELPVVVSDDEDLKEGSLANNVLNVGFNGKYFLETNTSSIKIQKFMIKGVAFKDNNKDNLLDKNDRLVFNQVVELLDDNNQVIETTKTDYDGRYSFTVAHSGDYKIRFKQAADSEISTKGDDNNRKASHVNQANWTTDTIKLDKNHLKEVRNIGFKKKKQEYGAIIIEHVDLKGNNLKNPEKKFSKIGDAYTTSKEEFKGYILKTEPNNKKGVYKAETQTITYRYQRSKPNISVEKTIKQITDKDGVIRDSGRFKKIGDVIYYNFKIKNIGNVTLNNVTLEDPLAGGQITLGKNTLAPNEQVTADITYKVSKEYFYQKWLQNICRVDATAPNGQKVKDADAVIAFGEKVHDIKLVKEADKKNLVAGDTITYSFKVTNTGNMSLRDVKVEDKLKGLSEVSPATISKLVPGGTKTFTATYKVKQSDVDKGTLDNTATVYAKDSEDKDVTATDNHTITDAKEGALTLTKGADKKNLVAGDTINYSFKVTNTGKVTLKDVKVEDKLEGLSEVSPATLDTLAPGESKTFTATYEVKQSDVDKGSLENTATVHAKDPKDKDLTDMDTHTITQQAEPKISVEKEALKVTDAEGKTYDNGKYRKLGDKIYYAFVVKNEGNVTVRDVTINDAKIGIHNLVVNVNLRPGDTYTYEVPEAYLVTKSDMDSAQKQISNIVKVVGTTPAGDTPEVSSENTVDKNPVPEKPDEKTPPAPKDIAISVEKEVTKVTNASGDKYTDGKYHQVGDKIYYEFKIRNVGEGKVHTLNIVDEKLNLDTTFKKELNPKQEYVFRYTKPYIVTQEDMQNERIQNIVNVVASGIDGKQTAMAKDNHSIYVNNEPHLPKTGTSGDMTTYLSLLFLLLGLFFIKTEKNNSFSMK